MTDEQFERFMAVQKAQFLMLQGIHQGLQAICIGNAWKVGTFNFNDAQKILDGAKQMQT